MKICCIILINNKFDLVWVKEELVNYLVYGFKKNILLFLKVVVLVELFGVIVLDIGGGVGVVLF